MGGSTTGPGVAEAAIMDLHELGCQRVAWEGEIQVRSFTPGVLSAARELPFRWFPE